MVVTAPYQPRTTAAEFTIDIDRARVGSVPTLQFIAGVLRHLPGLQGLPDAEVAIAPGLTPHHATYRLALPRDGGRLARARRVLRTVTGAAAALDELEQQATEIAAKNQALTQQLAETEQAAAAAQIREAWLALALEAGQVGTWLTARHPHGVVSRRWADLASPATPSTAPTSGSSGSSPRTAAHRAGAARRDARRAVHQQYRIVVDRRAAWLAVNAGSCGRRATSPRCWDRGRRHRPAPARHRLRSADRLIAAARWRRRGPRDQQPADLRLGNIDLLHAAARPGARGEGALTQVRDGIERIRDVVADLRAFARPDERLVGRVELRAVCEAALRITASLVRHRATITTAFAADTPTVLANESRLGQVVINLIVNASHACPRRPRPTSSSCAPAAAPTARRRSRSRTTAAASRPRCCRGCSTRSSPPRRPARAPAWA
jgi:signal transduction histidine kinase